MNTVIVVEIVLGIVVLGAAVRYAMWDTRQRRGATESTDTGSTDTGEAPVRSDERAAQQHPSEVADQHLSEVAERREGDEVAAVSAVSTAPEPPADAR